MKKICAVMLALVLSMSLSVSVFANGSLPSPGTSTTGGNIQTGTAGLPTPNDKTSPETGVESAIPSAIAAAALLGTAAVLANKKD